MFYSLTSRKPIKMTEAKHAVHGRAKSNDYSIADYVKSKFPTRQEAIYRFEKEFWKKGIYRTKGNLAKLARETGRSRERLYHKLRRLNLMHYVNPARPWKSEDDLIKRIIRKTEGITDYRKAKERFEAEIIYAAFKAAEGDIKKTAEYLGDKVGNMRKKIKKLRINKMPDEAEINAQECEEPPAPESDIDRLREILEEIENKRTTNEQTRKEV